MSILTIHGALYSDNSKGKCLKAGVAFRVSFRHNDKPMSNTIETISADRTYGDLWLSELTSIIDSIGDEDGFQFIKLITSQITTGKIAKKIERLLLEALTKKLTTRDEIEKLVFKDGKYTPRANNHLYVDLICVLLTKKHKLNINFEQHHLPSRTTMDLVKSLHKQIAPHKVLFKDKKKKPPLIR